VSTAEWVKANQRPLVVWSVVSRKLNTSKGKGIVTKEQCEVYLGDNPHGRRAKLRTFDHFPKDKKCVVCGTNEDDQCILVVIDGTGDGSIAEAEPVHLGCAVATNYKREIGLLYRLIKGDVGMVDNQRQTISCRPDFTNIK